MAVSRIDYVYMLLLYSLNIRLPPPTQFLDPQSLSYCTALRLRVLSPVVPSVKWSQCLQILYPKYTVHVSALQPSLSAFISPSVVASDMQTAKKVTKKASTRLLTHVCTARTIDMASPCCGQARGVGESRLF